MFGNFIEGIRSFAGGAGNATADDAVAQSSSLDLPALPSSWTSTSASKKPDATVIDLLSPDPISPVSSQQQGRMWSRPNRTYISDDEKRLVGDYRIPADAVAAPDPLSLMNRRQSGQGTTHKKPGANGSFKPINTIDDVNFGAGRKRAVTYSKQHRSQPPSIGHRPGKGQIAYLERKVNASISPIDRSSPRQELNASRMGASPGKRRKIGPPIIDLEHDDNSQLHEASIFSATRKTAGTSRVTPLSTKSSQSHHSIASASTMTVDMHANPPKSEFSAIDIVTTNRSRRARKPGSDTHQGTRPISPFAGGSVSSSVKGHGSKAPLESLRDQPVAQKNSRQKILESLNQGEEAARSSRQRKDLSIKHPNMRINQSTAEPATSHQRNVNNSMELHKQYKPAPSPHSKPMEDNSEDELASSTSHANQPTRKRDKSPRKKESSFALPLTFVRTHGFECRRTEKQTGREDLMLRGDKNSWRVTAVDPMTGNNGTKITIEHKDVIKAFTDDNRRLRLQGPRIQICIPIFDFEFVDTPDYINFRDNFVVGFLMNTTPVRRSQSDMITLFEKPLHNERVVTTEVVNHSKCPKNPQNSSRSRSSRAELVDGLTSTQNTLSDVKLKQEKDSEPLIMGTRTSSRVARSTRSSFPNYDLDVPMETRTVEKFSITQGLGQPWSKPLEYGQGRQRAVVHFDDLPRLDEEEYLNDSLIDFYMIYLFNKLSVSSDKVYFFNTYFFTQLTKNTGRESMNYKAVERWTSKIDVFSYDYLVVPINESTHWYLAIICNVSNIDRKPVIEDFDIDLTEATGLSHRAETGYNPLAKKEVEEQSKVIDEPSASRNDLGLDNVKTDEDPNLFDEESQLRLINRDEIEGEKELQTFNEQDQLVPSSPMACTTKPASNSFDGDAMSQGIFSKSVASPRNKRNKRKSVQSKKDPRQPIILLLDSLGQTRSGTVRALKDWLAAEGQAKRGMEATIKEKGYYPKASQIPMQSNFTDCGVYLLGYLEKFFRDPDEFKTKLLIGEMSAEDDWPELKPKEMRNVMRDIIFNAAEEQKVLRKASKKALKDAMKAKSKSPAIGSQLVVSNTGEGSIFRATELPLSKPPKVASSNPEGSEPALQQSIETPRSRLGSPFHYKSPSTHTIDHLQAPIRIDKVSGSPEQTLKSSALRTIPRQKSPEVRIPKRTPHSMIPRDINPASLAQSIFLIEGVQQTAKHSHTRSQSKGFKQAYDDPQLKWPGPKVTSSSPTRPKIRDGRMHHFSPTAESLEGSAGQPISIDSQEANAEETGAFSYQHSAFSANHKLPTVTKPRPPALQASPSVEEIAPLAQHMVKRKHQLSDERLAAKPHEANFNHKRRGGQRVRSRSRSQPLITSSSHFPPEWAEEEEEAPEPMDIDPPVDAEIQETPER